MINIHDGQITDLLNNSLRYNPETISISYAVLQEKQRILYLAERTLLMAAVEVLDEKILDYLAVELRTPAYDDSLPIETKRTLIKGTLPYYERLGTPQAVNWVINAIFGSGGIQEWFDYGGEPHHFRIDIPVTGAISQKLMEDLRHTISDVKRLTSWLDSITTSFEMEEKLYITPHRCETRMISVLPELRPVTEHRCAVYATPCLGRAMVETQLPQLEPVRGPVRGRMRFGAGAMTIMQTRLPMLRRTPENEEETQ